MRALGNEADLTQLTTDDIYIMRYLTGVCDEKLREKFLKEAKPTLKPLDKVAHQHEVAESSVKAMSTQRADLRQVMGGNKQQKSKMPLSKDLMDQRKCIRYGTTGHSAPDCHLIDILVSWLPTTGTSETGVPDSVKGEIQGACQ